MKTWLKSLHRGLVRSASPGLVVATMSVLVTLPGCAPSGEKRAKPVTIKGSDTMVILGQKWAEVYMKTYPGRLVQVTGGGSGTGIAALINGTTAIAQASRPMKDSEKVQAQERNGKPVEEHAVAKDGVTIYVHNSNPIETLTRQQIKDIYTAVITDWGQVGGPPGTIVLYGRESSSGTYVFFKEHVLEGADFAPATQTLPGTAAVSDAVSKDPAGIGYGGFAYGKDIKHVSVAPSAEAPGVVPNEETVRDGSYPLARDLYWYLLSPASKEASDLLQWVTSPEGQAVVKDVGYFPVKG